MPTSLREALRHRLTGENMTMNALQRALTEIVPAARVELEREAAGTVLVHLQGVPPEVGMAVAEELQALVPMGLRVSVSTLERDRLVYGTGSRVLGRTQAFEYSDVTITIGGHRYDGLESVTWNGVPAPAEPVTGRAQKGSATPKKPKLVSRYERISEEWLDLS